MSIELIPASGAGGGALTDHNHTAGAGDGGKLTDAVADGYIQFEAVAAPITPPANSARLYCRVVGAIARLFVKRDDGTEIEVGTAALADHGHTAPGDGGTIPHSVTTGQTADDHHAKSHAHNGADGSGTVAHSATTGQTANDHHNQAHNLRSADHPDVDLTAPADGDVLTYVAALSKAKFLAAGAASLVAHNHDTTAASDGGKLGGAAVDTYMDYEEASAPSAPGAGVGRIYGADLGGRFQFYVIDDVGTLQLAQVLIGSTTWDPASITGGSEVYTNVTVTGAELGDIVIGVSMNRNFLGDGLILRGHVSATDTVRVELGNFSTTNRDEASFTLRVAVLKVV